MRWQQGGGFVADARDACVESLRCPIPAVSIMAFVIREDIVIKAFLLMTWATNAGKLICVSWILHSSPVIEV
jgi:hypothetical protein